MGCDSGLCGILREGGLFHFHYCMAVVCCGVHSLGFPFPAWIPISVPELGKRNSFNQSASLSTKQVGFFWVPCMQA